jgi:AcrR family transcriptional regulator
MPASPTPAAKRTPRNARKTPVSRVTPYHHGKLRQALIDMAVTVAEETGKDIISVREVARRLGVSSGAPFRHFPDREALMTAVAEEATVRLRMRVERDLMDAPMNDPMAQLKMLGRSFIEWALRHPTQFRLVSSRRLFDFDSSERLPVHFGAVRQITMRLVEEAQAAGALPPGPVPELALGLRALVYGLARMQVDGQLPQWRVAPEAAERTLIGTMELLLDGLRR